MKLLSYSLRRKSDIEAMEWSGGTTSELYIYPPGTVYAERNFGFRISSATVALESSRFTELPGYRRHIMPLSGSMRLEHFGQYGVELIPYQVDRFEGSWQTDSFGTCTDFNLMCAEGYSGDMFPVKLQERIACPALGFAGILSLAKGLQVTCGNEAGTQFRAVLDDGDFLLVQAAGEQESTSIEITSEKYTETAAVAVTVALKPDNK